MAYELRFCRVQRALSGQDLAKILNCARSSVSRLETGEAKLDEKQAVVLDKAWDTGGRFSLMLWYARLGHHPDWLKQYLDIEATASVIKIYEAIVVPGLLQLPEYAHALLASGGVPDVDAAVERRMARQAILDQDPAPLLWILLSEGVLDWPIGGQEVMRRQLARLLEAAEMPNIGIRVVPRSAGAHAGADGSFMIMTGEYGDIAYTESPGGGRLVPSAVEVRSYQTRYDRIGQHALPERASRDLIKQFMEAMR
ncbi:helix-turn-helix domain-containing protein [Actinomadura scrupuli]|uniref:helix-turn-helix domain-containing protein n=1 Tax=Actinomadura scrupuli TaxID=559629 RepID=UPI003D993E01